jgi:hypothetical protein
MPWWGWMLGGCGGCAVVSVIALAVVAWMGFNFVQTAAKNVGPVDQKSLQQGLGEVPLYPGVVINGMRTQAMMIGLRTTEKATGKQPGSIVKTLAIGDSSDAPEKVMKFYQQKLKAKGWTVDDPAGNDAVATGQRMFTKGSEVVVIDAQSQSNGTLVMVIRGGSELNPQLIHQKK